jgi:hypothetical protein
VHPQRRRLQDQQSASWITTSIAIQNESATDFAGGDHVCRSSSYSASCSSTWLAIGAYFLLG